MCRFHNMEPCPICIGLDSYNSPVYGTDGEVNWRGMANYWMEKYMEVCRENQEMRRLRKAGLTGNAGHNVEEKP
jgi:hypothetical protein